MANYRQIHTQIWKDEWFGELNPKEKMLFIYLFSNESSSLSGIYKLSLKVAAFETGLPVDFIASALAKFEASRKVYYRDGVIWVVNMWRYHSNASPKVKTRIMNELANIPDGLIKKAYLSHNNQPGYRIDTVSIPDVKANLREANLREAEAIPAEILSPASISPSIQAEKIFQAVTAMPTFPFSELDKCIPAIEVLLRQRTPEETIVYLQTFWIEWRARKYGPQNCAWLYDWAISGSIPEQKKSSNNGRKIEVWEPPEVNR